MPIVNKGELGESEAQHTESPVTTARRRRGGRRVVRDTGAAGASLKLQVEDHSAPLFEEPKIAAPARSEATEEQPARRRHRHIGDESASTASSKESAPLTRRRSSSASDSDVDARASKIAEELFSSTPHAARTHASRPMTSLLFQEPVIPAGGTSGDGRGDLDDRGSGEDREDREERSARRRRRNRSESRDDRESRDVDEARESRGGRCRGSRNSPASASSSNTAATP